MIIEYDEKYDEEIKDLFVELQEHISKLDKEEYNVLTDECHDNLFDNTLKEIKDYEGKMFLMLQKGRVVGLVVGVINNDEIDNYDFKAPKRGRITELIVSKKYRSSGIGAKLLERMESYLTSVGCKSILIGVFAYNDSAIKFYERNGYHIRMTDMIKVNEK